jgi:hypothetical protein
VLDDEEVLDEDVAKDDSAIISVYLHLRSVEEIGIIDERMQTLDRLRSHMVPPAQRIPQSYVVYYPTPWSSRRHWMLQSLDPTLCLANWYQRGGRAGWVGNPMKLRRSLCMAIVARKNKWLYLFYRVDEDTLH